MPCRTAIFLACALLTITAACGKGKMGIKVTAFDDFDTQSITRLHVRVREEQSTGPNTWNNIYWEAYLDRGAGWDGHLPINLIYDGYVHDAAKYSATVSAYAGDQIIAKSGGYGYVTAPFGFSNVQKVVEVTLTGKGSTFP